MCVCVCVCVRVERFRDLRSAKVPSHVKEVGFIQGVSQVPVGFRVAFKLSWKVGLAQFLIRAVQRTALKTLQFDAGLYQTPIWLKGWRVAVEPCLRVLWIYSSDFQETLLHLQRCRRGVIF